MWNHAELRSGRQAISRALGALLILAAPSLAQQGAANSQPKHKLTDDEKVATWKGEKVVLLPSYHPRDFWGDYSAPHDRQFDCYLDGDRSHGLPYKDYLWKTGVITEIRQRENQPYWPMFDSIVALDNSSEKIVAGHPHYLGFASEMEAAKSLTGRPFWAKGVRYLIERPTLQLGSQDQKKIEVRNTQKLTVSGAEWGEYNNYAVRLCFKTDSGQEVCEDNARCMDSRFHLLSSSDRCADTDGVAAVLDLYDQDPRKTHPGWSATIWGLIEKQVVAIGMTEEMAKVACGGTLYDEGAVIDIHNGKVAPIYSCGGKRFLVQGGKVTKYVESRPM